MFPWETQKMKKNQTSATNVDMQYYASSVKSCFRSHLKSHSGEESNKCNQCIFASSHTSALRTHLKRHSGERPYKCNQCDYASSHVFSLRTHLKRHGDFIAGIPFEDTYENTQWRKCNQCDYACSDPSALRTHLKTHTGEKPSKCNRCGEYCSWWCLL